MKVEQQRKRETYTNSSMWYLKAIRCLNSSKFIVSYCVRRGKKALLIYRLLSRLIASIVWDKLDWMNGSWNVCIWHPLQILQGRMTSSPTWRRRESLMTLQACARRLMSLWSPSCVWEAKAASSAMPLHSGCDDAVSRGNKVMIAKWRPSWIAVLDFWIFLKLQERAEIERKVFKTNAGRLLWTKNI